MKSHESGIIRHWEGLFVILNTITVSPAQERSPYGRREAQRDNGRVEGRHQGGCRWCQWKQAYSRGFSCATDQGTVFYSTCRLWISKTDRTDLFVILYFS